MLLIAYNYGKPHNKIILLPRITIVPLALHTDDWESIFGDPTKFGYGLITVGFEIIHFLQHYVIYRRAWMREYKLGVECECIEGACKHSKENLRVCSVVASSESKNVTLKKVERYV